MDVVFPCLYCKDDEYRVVGIRVRRSTCPGDESFPVHIRAMYIWQPKPIKMHLGKSQTRYLCVAQPREGPITDVDDTNNPYSTFGGTSTVALIDVWALLLILVGLSSSDALLV